VKFVSLFAGIGGIDLGLERAGMTCVGQVEWESFPQAVLQKHWPDVPKIEDVRDFAGHEFGEFDLLAGGYPCQPFSVAGSRKGKDDIRHLWPEVHRIIRNVRPRVVFLENVTGHLSLGFSDVLGDLASCGYDAEWDCIPAAAVGAPHRRDRVFIVATKRTESMADTYDSGRVYRQTSKHATEAREHAQRELGASSTNVAYAHSQRRDFRRANAISKYLPNRDGNNSLAERERHEQQSGVASSGAPRRTKEDVADTSSKSSDGSNNHTRECLASRPSTKLGDSSGQTNVADTYGAGCEKQHAATVTNRPGHSARSINSFRRKWPAEPNVGRVAHGVPNRVDRLKGLGNAVVPQVAEYIGRRILRKHA